MAEVIDYGRFEERLRAADSTEARWELLRRFQREWGYREPGGDPKWPRGAEDAHRVAMRRFADEELGREDAYDRLADVDVSLPIPRALDEWWELPFNSFTYRPRLYFTNPVWPPEVRPSPTGTGDVDGLPEENPFVGADADRRVCVFKTEYQACNEWGYLAAEAARHDPRVLVSTEDGWELQARSISEFFLQLAVERIPAHYGWNIRLCHQDLEDDPGIVERLRAVYRPMGLLPWRELMADCLVYGAPDAVVHHDRGGEVDFPLMIQARNREALLRTAWTLGVDVTADVIEPPSRDEDDDGGDDEASHDDGVGPVALREGDADGAGRWTVRWRRDTAAGGPDGHAAEHFPADLVGEPEPEGRTAVAAATLPDGPVVAMAWKDGRVRLRDMRSGQTAELWIGTGITALALRPDATLEVTADGVVVALYLDLRLLLPGRELKADLNEVDWGALRGKGGSAQDVPDLVVQAASPKLAQAEPAVDRLREVLCHEGEVYSAAASAVPFLLRLVGDPGTRVRENLLFLMSDLARSSGEAGSEHDGGPACPEALRPAQDARSAVAAGIPVLLGLLDDEDRAVRAGAAWVLADFPDHRPDLIPILRTKVAGTADPATAAALVLTIGELGERRDDPPLEWLGELLTSGTSREVRAAAAVALLWNGVAEPHDGLIAAIEAELAAPLSALDHLPWTKEHDRQEMLTSALHEHPSALVKLARTALETFESDSRHTAVTIAWDAMLTCRAAPPRLLPPLIELAGAAETERGLRQRALELVSQSGPAVADVAEAVVPFLDDDDFWVAELALRALARAGDSRCLPALIADLAEHRRLEDLAGCLAGLAEHAGELAPALRSLLADTGVHADRLGNALAGIRPWGRAALPLLPELVALLERRPLVAAAALTLGALRDGAAEAVPLLRPHLGEGQPRKARTAAAWAIWQITGRADEALPVLAPALRSRLSTAEAERLYDLGPAARPAVPVLRPLLDDSGHGAHRAACVVVHRATGDASLVPRLVDAVAADRVGLLAMRSLASVGAAAAAALPALRRILESERVLAETEPDRCLALDLACREAAAGALAAIEPFVRS